ncbi:MAG: hypothetical protein H0S85_04580 [Desulfovibrionaceae bacterium]|jgi:hypothetical protein|nr:hypothetical protein [Desulfovibrionaceae bacterium]
MKQWLSVPGLAALAFVLLAVLAALSLCPVSCPAEDAGPRAGLLAAPHAGDAGEPGDKDQTERPEGYACPDELKCRQRMMDNYGNVSQQTIGTLHAASCYSFPVGCRPWHCKGDTTTWEYWQARCDEKFPSCKDDHAGYTEPFCTPHFVTY